MKKIIPIIIIFSFIFVSTQSFAADKNKISMSKSLNLLEANSRTLGDMDKSMLEAWKDYNDTVAKAESIDIYGTKISIMGVETYISFDQLTTMMMTQQKELMPAQLKYAWEMSRDSRTVTKNSLTIALRSLYLGLYSSDSEYKQKLKKLEQAGTINKQDKLKFKRGLITELDLEESDYNLLAAKKDADTSKRSLDNILRSFNSFIGADIHNTYDEVMFEEKYDSSRLKDMDFYLQKAMKERLEILSAETQLSLTKKNKEIIDRIPTNLNYADIRKQYDSLVDSIEIQKLKLDKLRLDIEQGIKNAYVDVSNSGNNVKSLSRTYEKQKNNLENMKLRYKQGQISKNTLAQLELAVEQVKSGYRAALFDFNTKLLKLEYSAGLGPAYQEGSV